MSPRHMEEFARYAVTQVPNEACAVLVSNGVKESLVLMRNTHSDPVNHFRFDPSSWQALEQNGAKRLSVIHSHVQGSADPTMHDKLMCEETKLPWHIFSVSSQDWKTILPTGFKLPLYGREFIFGVVDCYTLIRDYYRETLGVELPDFPRTMGFWARNEPLYEASFHLADFVQVGGIAKVHDVYLLKINSSVCNHAGVYLGHNLILNHAFGRVSGVQRFSGVWQACVGLHLRHKTQL